MTDDTRLSILGQYTPEGQLTPGYGDHYLFLVGRDDVHGIMHYLLTHETLFLKFNQFGYDDEQLNQDILNLFKNPNVHIQATLDKSQAAGVHEKKIIELDKQLDPVDFSNSFAIGESSTHSISHTKGGVLLGLGIGFEGSANWSDSGEGTGINIEDPQDQPKGWRAQNNTFLVTTNPVFISRFSARLDVEHHIALTQSKGGAI